MEPLQNNLEEVIRPGEYIQETFEDISNVFF